MPAAACFTQVNIASIRKKHVSQAQAEASELDRAGLEGTASLSGVSIDNEIEAVGAG